jgi:hypothetical protein
MTVVVAAKMRGAASIGMKLSCVIMGLLTVVKICTPVADIQRYTLIPEEAALKFRDDRVLRTE